jgi:aryl-alcohol dehydrogenase-like predicted oxidoreductase
MSKTKIGLGLAALGDLNISILGIHTIDKSQEALLRMLLVFLILPINMAIRYFDTAPSYGKGEEFLTNWNSKYHEDTVQNGIYHVANWHQLSELTK